MIVWQGFGFIVGVIGMGFLVLAEYITRTVTKNEFYFNQHGWIKTVAFLLAAGVVWLVARHYDSRPGKVVIEKGTGKEITLRRQHSLFFVPMKFWTYIYVGLGVLFLFVT